MFSKRTGAFCGVANALYRDKAALEREGVSYLDFISGNVTGHGIHYPRTLLKKGLSRADRLAKIYQPDPQGQVIARLAIQKYYEKEGVSLPAEQIVLTPGTSVSYLYLFKLLAHPGDEILCPTPTYPLFDSIAAFCDVKIVSYRLVPRHRWEIDFDHLQSKLSKKTRALVLISPHNPTGAVATDAEIKRLGMLAKTHNLPIISDEVFSPFLFQATRLPRPSETDSPLVFTLNGFSKMLALPGIKIGWIGISGDKPLVKKSVRLLAGMSDTFLPVNEQAQYAVPTLFEACVFMQRYPAEIFRRFKIAMALMQQTPAVSFIPPAGGFYLAVGMADPKSHDEVVARALLGQEKILVHPGYFYGLPPRYLVFSFILQPRILREALARMIHFLETRGNGHCGATAPAGRRRNTDVCGVTEWLRAHIVEKP